MARYNRLSLAKSPKDSIFTHRLFELTRVVNNVFVELLLYFFLLVSYTLTVAFPCHVAESRTYPNF